MAASLVEVRFDRPSTPESIESDLAALWLEAARDGPIARARMANLVLVCEHRPGVRVDFDQPIDVVPIDDVARRHPSRVIVLHHSPDETQLRAPIAAAVAVIIFGTDGARYGVERIALRSTAAQASLPSIVRNLVLGDAPTSVWLTDDVSRAAPLPALVHMGRQLLYDSATWKDVRAGFLGLAPFLQPGPSVVLTDLNWRRLLSIRQALVHAVKTMGRGPIAASDIRIAHAPGSGAMAWLLAGWLTARLGGGSPGEWQVRVEPVELDEDLVTVSLGATTARLNRREVAVTGPEGTRAFLVGARQESDADAAVAELSGLASDGCLREAMVALVGHFGR